MREDDHHGWYDPPLAFQCPDCENEIRCESLGDGETVECDVCHRSLVVGDYPFHEPEPTDREDWPDDA